MSRKFSYIFVLFGLLGFITLIPGVVDKTIYTYFRIINGSTIEAGDKCFQVPYGWVIDYTGYNSTHLVFDLRKKTENDYLFVSVIVGPPSIIPNYQNLSPIKEIPGLYRVYELEKLAPTNSVRYWSSIADQTLLLIGSDLDTLVELSAINWIGDC